MAGTAQDVEAGRAYVTLYLRRTKYDRQVDDLSRESKQSPTQTIASQTEAGASIPHELSQADDLGREHRQSPTQAISSQTEAGASIPHELSQAAMRGAASFAGASVLQKIVPALRNTGVAAAGTAVQVAAVGTAAAVTAPAVAATGTAATGAAVGFGAMLAAMAPVVIPLAAIATAAGVVYVAIFKWEKLPIIVRVLAMAFFPLIAVVRLAVNAFKLLRLAVQTIFLPFTLAAAAVRGLRDAILAIPSAAASAVSFLGRMTAAASKMAVEVAKAAASAARSLAGIPGALVRHTSDALRGVGSGLAKLGTIGAGAAAAIVGPMTMAAKSWAAYGEKIRGVQNDLLRFELSAEEASIIARVSEQTGESIQKLAEQMRDGTRDFSRWRNEMRQSGTLMSGAGLSAALALSRAYYSLRESVAGLKNAIGEAIGPALTETTQIITGMIRAVTRWVTENKPLVAQIFQVASGVAAAATAIVTLGGAIAGAGAILTPFTAALAAIAGGLAIVEVRTGAGRSVWAAYGGSVKRVYNTVVQYLGQMAAFAGRVMSGVKDAMLAGNLAGAVAVMWAAAKVAWMAALLEIDTLTGGTFGGILQSLAAGRWSAAGESAMNALQQAWLEGVGIMANVWDTVVDAFDAAMDAMKGTLAAMFNSLKSWGAEFLGWMSNSVLLPLAKSVAEYSSVAAAPIFTAASKAAWARTQIKAGLKTPEQLAADQAGRERDSAGAKATRQAASDKARLEREQKIEALRQRQAELAGQSGSEARREQTANQAALDAAIAAAKAARGAADAGRLNESDFAISQKTQSIVRFSGEALGLSVGRDDPARETAKLSRDQIKELRRIANGLDITLREVLRLQQMGGFA